MICEGCGKRPAGAGYRFCFHCGASEAARIRDRIHASEPRVLPGHRLVHGNIQAVQKRGSYTKVDRRQDAIR